MKEDLKTEISGKAVAITHVSWTSANEEYFETVTASFITGDWQLQYKVLETFQVAESHSGETIAETLQSTKDRWHLDITAMVTGNARNEIKASKSLQWKRFGCIGHNISLVVQKGLSITEVNQAVDKGRSLVSCFHHSSQAMDVLLEKQKLLISKELQGYAFINCPTRWDSTLDMLVWLSEQLPALHAVATDSASNYIDIQVQLFTFEEQQLVDGVVALLKPFKKATEILSAENQPTLSMVTPVLLKLEKILEPSETDGSAIRKMKDIMLATLETRQDPESQHCYNMAAALDIRTKSLNFLSPDQRLDLWDRMRKVCTEVYPDFVKVKTEPLNDDIPNSPFLLLQPTFRHANDTNVQDGKSELSTYATPAKKRKEDDWLDDILGVSEPPVKSQQEMITIEVEKYKAESSQAGVSPLAWWKTHELYYPTLAKLAKKLLVVPACSVPPERIYSLTDNVYIKERNHISPENVDIFIFLKKNSS